MPSRRIYKKYVLLDTEAWFAFGERKAIFICLLEKWLENKGFVLFPDSDQVWFFHSHGQWAADMNLSVSTVRRIIGNLKKQGIVMTMKQPGVPPEAPLLYSINVPVLEQRIRELLADREISFEQGVNVQN